MSMFKQFRNKKSEESPLQVLKAYIILDKSYSRKRNEMELSMILSYRRSGKGCHRRHQRCRKVYSLKDHCRRAVSGFRRGRSRKGQNPRLPGAAPGSGQQPYHL